MGMAGSAEYRADEARQAASKKLCKCYCFFGGGTYYDGGVGGSLAVSGVVELKEIMSLIFF